METSYILFVYLVIELFFIFPQTMVSLQKDQNSTKEDI